jgi:two-component system, NtrC family, nitrogen regulation sensor histidine kinase NtrY
MGFSASFRFGIGWRLALLLASCVLAAWMWSLPERYAATLLASLLPLGAIASLYNFVSRTNREVARFVDAMMQGDFSQSFSKRYGDGAFAALAASLETAFERRRALELNQRRALQTAELLVEDSPAPLLRMDGDHVQPLNRAARHWLGTDRALPLGDPILGANLSADLKVLTADAPRSSQARDGSSVLLSASDLRGGTAARIVSIMPAQGALDAVEMRVWRDLVRVLTHEIMNSLTPVTSLARTAAGLMAKADTGTDSIISDARAAVETVARRSDGLMQFVQSYRALTRIPTVTKKAIMVSDLFAEMAQLFAADWPAEQITLSLDAGQIGATITIDADLIGQVLLNLLRNAAQAQATQVHLAYSQDQNGRAQLTIDDNGPGIATDLRSDIFLPFFTTKAQGTGVGLSLSRQIAIAHGGNLLLDESPQGGARFRLLL